MLTRARCCQSMTRVSIWVPTRLIRKARSLAPRRMRPDLGCIVGEALEGYVIKRKHEAFDRGMARMAEDPQVLRAINAPYPDPSAHRVKRKTRKA